jgi:fatty-acyl-CoA synthase
VPDEKFGEEICAVIILHSNFTKIDNIINKLKGNIAHYKIPKYIKYVKEFPLTITGKI